MKVDDFFPMEIPPVLMNSTISAVSELFEIRKHTFEGFLRVEETRGFMKPSTSIASSLGQEMVRTLLIRGLEELGEAGEAKEKTHFYEEMVDAINFLLSIAIMDETLPHTSLYEAFLRGWDTGSPPLPTSEHLVRILHAAFPLLAKLRNRAWQQNPQSTYFDGYTELVDFTYALGEMVGSTFASSWQTFVEYYLAKDAVLQWRLQSNY